MHLFIINPVAGKKDCSKELIAQIEALALSECEYVLTKRPGDATKIASEYCEKCDNLRIYSCGGDGTLNEIIRGAYGYPHCEIGIVPIGSGNDFMRSLEQVETANFLDIKKQVTVSSVSVDLMKVGENISINIISAGFDSAVAENMVRFKKLPFVSGAMAYNLSLIYCLFTKRRHRFSLVADGTKIDDGGKPYTLALAANGCYYGSGYKAAPRANLSDGLIDFIRVPNISIPKFLKFVGIYKKGEHLDKLNFLELIRCKKLEIVSDNDISLNLDGEIIQIKNPVIEIIPSAMKIIVPN